MSSLLTNTSVPIEYCLFDPYGLHHLNVVVIEDVAMPHGAHAYSRVREVA